MREEQLHKLQARSPRRELNRDVQRGVAERVLRVHDGLCAARLRALQKQLEDVKGALPNAEVQQSPPRRGLLPSVHSVFRRQGKEVRADPEVLKLHRELERGP